MKKAILFMSAVAMLAAISCNKAEVNEPQTETPSVNDAVESLEFVAYTEVETKTTLNGLSTEWVAGDNISVNGVNYITNESGSKVIFTKDNEDDIDPTAPYIAKYPWCMVDESGDMAFYSILDEEGKYEISSDCITDALAVAYSESEAILEFKNVMSLMKFQVPEEFTEEITEIRISTTEPLASNILVDYNNGKPTWRIEEGGTPSTEIILVTEGSFDPKATYYLPVLPGPKTNLTVRINGYLAATGKSITFERSRIHNVGTLPAPVASDVTLQGINGNWSSNVTMYNDIYWSVALNVKSSSTEFKFTKGSEWIGAKGNFVHKDIYAYPTGGDNIKITPNEEYDIYYNHDGGLYMVLPAGTDINTDIYVATDMFIRGNYTNYTGYGNWGKGRTPVVAQGKYYCFKNYKFTSAPEFKFTTSEEGWDYQYSSESTLQINTWTTLKSGSGLGSNTKYGAAGTYDIYTTSDKNKRNKVLIVTTGTAPAAL